MSQKAANTFAFEKSTNTDFLKSRVCGNKLGDLVQIIRSVCASVVSSVKWAQYKVELIHIKSLTQCLVSGKHSIHVSRIKNTVWASPFSSSELPSPVPPRSWTLGRPGADTGGQNRFGPPCRGRPADRESGDWAGPRAQQASIGFFVCEMGTRTRPYPPHRQAAGRPARRERDHGGLPKDGPGRGGAGAGLAARLLGTSGLRIRRRGPMVGAQGCGPRLLLGLPGPEAEAGVQGRASSAPAACPGCVAFKLPAPPRIHCRRFLKTESSDSQWLPLERSCAERLRGGPMRAQDERLTAAVIGEDSGDKADRW